MKKLVGFIVLFHAAYSAYEYRKYKAAQMIEEITLPYDVNFPYG